MPILKSFVTDPEMIEVFARYPDGIWSLCELHDIKLRGKSPLSVGERELIAAYVSGVNACGYCFSAHSTIAAAFGIDAALFERLMEDPAGAGVAPKMVPILQYVRKLTLTPAKMTGQDAEAIYAAGWTEQALVDAVFVCALFNFMNRIVAGTGIVANEAVNREFEERVHGHGNDAEMYRNFARMAGAQDPG